MSGSPRPRLFRVVGPAGCPADWGINYRPKGNPKATEKRAQVGAIVGDLPAGFRDELLTAGLIREAK